MSVLTSIIALSGVLGFQGSAEPVSLGRVFTKNEKLAYSVTSSLNAQSRQRGLQTWIPSDYDMNYDFTEFVEEMKADGIAVLHYQRPVVHQIEGETFNSAPKETDEKVNMNFRLTISPINEILEAKDLNEKPAKAPKKTGSNVVLPHAKGKQGSLGGILSQFVGEMFRLSLFTGSFDSALDFAPKTPFDTVKVGETWKRTVGYQPQKLQGKGNKQAVQRLDYTFTYKGVVDSEGKKVYRVEGTLDFKSDLAEFINQLVGMKAEDTGLKKVPLSMKSTILFDLDMKTRHTILAQAKTESGFALYVTDYPDDPVEEENIKARTTLRLVGDRVIPPVVKKKN